MEQGSLQVCSPSHRGTNMDPLGRCVLSTSKGVRGLWTYLDIFQARWERKVSPKTTTVAPGFKTGCPGAQALPACMVWVTESQTRLEPKTMCTEASVSSLVSGRLRCPLGSPENTVLCRGAAGSWQKHTQEEARDHSDFSQRGPSPITDTGLVCPGITGGGGGNFCPGWGCGEGWHAAP